VVVVNARLANGNNKSTPRKERTMTVFKRWFLNNNKLLLSIESEE